MAQKVVKSSPVRIGDTEGSGTIYDSSGNLIMAPGESCQETGLSWDMNVRSPWRRLMPKILFMGFNGKAESKLYITTSRVVLIREIDAWRQLAAEMTPLGMPSAIAEEAHLKKLKAAGFRQFCEVRTGSLKRTMSRKFTKYGSRLDLKLVGIDGTEYAISFWKTDGKDTKTLLLLESQFKG